MMNKKYLMKGFAALALVAGFSSCVKDVASVTPAEQEAQAKENAELQLGITIPTGQTWNMASQVEANVTVNGDYGASYTVSIYENNPLTNNNKAVVLGKADVTSGGTATISFTCPDAATMVFAAIKDEKGYTYVKPATIKNGKVEVVFGENTAGSRAMRAASATNSHVDIPTCTVTNAYVQSFLEGAKEPTDANVADNYDNGYYKDGSITITVDPVLPQFDLGSVAKGIMYSREYCGASENEMKFFDDTFVTLWNQYNAMGLQYNGKEKVDTHNAKIDKFYELYNAVVNFAGENGVSSWLAINTWPTRGEYSITGGTWVADEAYVTKFKITGEWNKLIGVLGTEEADGDARTVYVSGTWTIPAGEEQRVGGGAVVVVVEGGEIVIPEGSVMNFVNQARLVNAGGTISGAGTINVTNGNNPGEEGYNSGTISIGKFNQNFGTFFNYGTFANYATELNGGAGTSTFVNRGHMYISGAPKGSSSANMQIKNACWFEASGEVACKLIENGSGSYFKAAALDLSCSEGGEGIGTYIAADENSSMVITGAVKLNSTLIYGPNGDNSSYLEFDNINFINVGERYPVTGNLNIYVGGFTGENGDAERFENAWNLNMAAGSGAEMVGKKAFNTASTEASDCAPEFVPDPPTTIYEDAKVYTYAFEDQTAGSDYDMNDVVLKVSYHVVSTNSDGQVEYDKTNLDATLVAAGATYNIKIKIGNTYLFNEREIHNVLGVNEGVMVNTANGKAVTKTPQSCTVPVPANWNGKFEELPVSIEVLSTGKTYSYPNTDTYPHAVMIPVDWRWPLERIIVTEAYKGKGKTSVDPEKEGQNVGKITLDNGKEVFENSFEAWAATPAAYRTLDMKDWYNNPDKSKTMTNTSPATTE